jgi:hypothetical protein
MKTWSLREVLAVVGEVSKGTGLQYSQHEWIDSARLETLGHHLDWDRGEPVDIHVGNSSRLGSGLCSDRRR